jgi:hypothetical protein
VRRYGEAGAHTVALQPTEDDPDPERFIEVVGAAQELLAGS